MDLEASLNELARQNEALVQALQDITQQLAEARRDMAEARAEYYKHDHGATSSGGITTKISLPS